MKFKLKYLFMFLVMFSLALCADFAFNKHDYSYVEQQAVQAEDEIVIPSKYCLRDDYFLLTTNQHGQGLCWDFASSTVFTTAVMHSTNQYIDYSEGWISETYAKQSSYYTPGDGGYFGAFENAIRDYGIIQEQDFNYSESYQVSRENVNDMYEYFSQFSDKGIINNYKTKSYSVSHYADEETKQYQRNLIKRHIMTQSALYVSFGWATGSAKYNGRTIYFKHPNPESTVGGHALTIVGWDDDLEVVFNNVRYKGAWLFLNSWGDGSGYHGIYYIFYDDKQVSSFSGYVYNEIYDDLYFFNKIEDSTAQFNTNLKGAFTGTFEATSNETKQKNIFTDPNNVSLTYSYKISDNTRVSNISIFNLQQDVTKDFVISNDTRNKLITITAKDTLALSTYKIKFTYTNGTKTESSCGAFSIINGTETEYASVSISPSASTNTNFNMNLVGPLNNCLKQISYSTEGTTGQMSVSMRMSTYSGAYYVKVLNAETGVQLQTSYISPTLMSSVGVNFPFNLGLTNHYKLIIVGENGENSVDIFILKINASEGEVHARVNYTLFDGKNNEENASSCVVSKDKMAVIKSPTRDGYGFCGWYYSSDYSKSSMLKNSGEDFYLDLDHAIHHEQYSTYWARYNEEIAPLIFYSYIIYAKWIKLEDDVEYYKIVSTANGNGEISEVGIIYVPENSNKLFSINSVGYIVTEIYLDGVLIPNMFYDQFLRDGVEFPNITDNHSLMITFVARTDITYYVCHWLEALDETEYEANGKYYELPIVEIFYDSADKMTQAKAKTFDHFVAQSFVQEKIKPTDDTMINIYYHREKFNVTITFSGAGITDSTKFDINEEVLYGQTKTYSLCPIGYKVVNCVVDNVQSYEKSITFKNIKANHKVQVSLEVEKYNITFANMQNGQLYCKGTTSDIDVGAVRTFTVIADEGYKVKEVKVNGESVEINNNNQFSILISKDLFIEATFEENIKVDPDQGGGDSQSDAGQGEGIIENKTDNGSMGMPIVFISACVVGPIVLIALWFIIKKKRMSL